MIKNHFKLFIVTFVIILSGSTELFALTQEYECKYTYCVPSSCTKTRCLSSGVACRAYQTAGGDKGIGPGSWCCLNQCCPSGYYDCCSTTYGCCCPVSPPPPPCDPKTSCSCSFPLSSLNQENGSKTVSCPDGCGGTARSTCYCPAGSCTLLDSIWLDDEPVPPYREYELTVPVDPTKYVTNCSQTDQKTCYTTNQYPTVEDIQIVPAGNITGYEIISLINGKYTGTSSLSPINNLFEKFVSKLKAADFSDEQVMGFSSTTHSGIGINTEEGGGVNNPVGLTATYSDPDGQDDILAIYVWWNPSSTKSFNTPQKIDVGNEETTANDNWGFMISRDGVGEAWNKVYVPGENNVFVEEGTVGEAITISGLDGEGMVILDNISVTDQGTNEIHLELTMKFNTNTNDTVLTEKYNLWGMANDYAGFTEFEEDGNIKDFDKWEDSGTDWSLDMEKPIVNIPSTSTVGDDNDPKIGLSFTAKDDELAYVRVDACYSSTGSDEPQSLKADDNTPYPLLYCDDISNYFETLDITDDGDLISSGRPTPLEGVKTFTKEIEIGIEGNDNGSITFYITAMDHAGNYQQEQVIYKLGDWVAVTDGLVFGDSGISSPTRVLESDWDSNSELKESEYFSYDTIDLTNDVLLGGTTSEVGFLGSLEKYDINHSFKASKYAGVPINAIYSELFRAYELKKRNISYIEKTTYSDLDAPLSSYCDGGEPYDFCVIKNTGSIAINPGFECDTKGLILSGGDVNINTEVLNSENSDACIILSQNDINVSIVDNKSDADVNYDIVQSFMIAGEDININSGGTNNGLLVEGGLFGFGNENGTSILNNRSISWGYRPQYPIIAIDNNAKYGLLSKYLFGSQIEIFKLEIGFKPY